MAKKTTARKSGTKAVAKKKPTVKKSKNKKLSTVGRVLLILLSITGLATMIYLTSLHFKDGAAVCDLNAKLSCSVVNSSEYSELFGIPVAMLGIVFFLGMLGATLLRYTRDTLKTMVFASLAFLGPSLYLTALEIFVIDSICLFCELSKVIVVLIIVTALFTLKPMKKDEAKNLITSGVVVGLLLAGGTFMAHRMTSTAPAEGEYVAFAENLTEEGWVVYGSATCQFCGRQRAAFGDSFEYIHEIECDPRNEHDQAELCVAKGINHTPTWVLENEAGETIEKLPSGMYPLDELSELTGVEIPK